MRWSARTDPQRRRGGAIENGVTHNATGGKRHGDVTLQETREMERNLLLKSFCWGDH